MGTSTSGRRIARQAKIRLYRHDDGGPPYSLQWHWMGYDLDDGTVTDTGSGDYTGEPDEMLTKLAQLVSEVADHLRRGVDPFVSA